MLIDPYDFAAPTVESGSFPAFHAPQVRSVTPTGARSYLGISYSLPVGFRQLEMDLHVPERASEGAPVPVVLWIHGGAWMFGSRGLLPPNWPLGSVAQSLIDAGLAVASIDYRHAHEAPFPAQLHDAKAAIRYLKAFADQLGIDPDRVGVWGESAGGHLAALCALVSDPELEGIVGVPGHDSSVDAAVCFYPVTDVDRLPPFFMPDDVQQHMLRTFGELPVPPLEALLAGSTYSDPAGRSILSPVHHVTSAAPPFLLVHGDLDLTVPLSQSELLAAALTAKGVPVELDVVAGASHVFDGTDPMPQIHRAVAYLVEQLTR